MTDSDDTRDTGPPVAFPSRRQHGDAEVEHVDVDAILDDVGTLDVRTWRYTAEDGGTVERVGPAAEEFYETVGLWEDADRAAGDADGVALAAIQGLTAVVETQRERLDTQERRIEAQRETIAEQRDDLESLRSTVESIVSGLVALRGEALDDRTP
jgi:hypothetical protein